MFVIIMVSIIHTRNASKSESRMMNKLAAIRRQLVTAIGLAVLFGLGWGLGLTATTSDVREVTFVFQVIFAIFVGSQGVLIFVFQGLRSDKARKAWKRWANKLYCCEVTRQAKKQHPNAVQLQVNLVGRDGGFQTPYNARLVTVESTAQSLADQDPKDRSTPPIANTVTQPPCPFNRSTKSSTSSSSSNTSQTQLIHSPPVTPMTLSEDTSDTP